MSDEKPVAIIPGGVYAASFWQAAIAYKNAIKERGYPTYREIATMVEAARKAKWLPAVTENFDAITRAYYAKGYTSEAFAQEIRRRRDHGTRNERAEAKAQYDADMARRGK